MCLNRHWGVATPPPSGGTDQAESATTANVSIAYPPPEDKPIMTAIDKAANSLDTFLRILLGIVSLAILAGAIFLMVKLDSGSRSQGGRFYVAIAALVILGAVDSQFRQLIERRAPFSIATTETESRYAMVSLLLMLISTVVLFGAAWFLP